MISRAVILVIPDWFSLALSLFVLWLTVTGWIRSSRIRSWCVRNIEQTARACEAYARSDDALADVLEASNQPLLAGQARERATQNRAMAQKLRDGIRRLGWKGLFRAAPASAEPRTPPDACPSTPEAAESRTAPVTDPVR